MHLPAMLCLSVTLCFSLSLAVNAAETGPAVISGEYRIVAGESWLRVLVLRGGLLRGLGHNHVVSTRGLTGTVQVAEPVTASQIWLQLPLAALQVDRSSARQAEGERFAGEVPDDDIEATRNNMLGPRLLDQSRHDAIRLHSSSISGEFPDLSIRFECDIAGVRRWISVPAQVTATHNSLQVSGEHEITHRQLGLQPFSAALGTLRVRDELTLKYSIVAERVAP